MDDKIIVCDYDGILASWMPGFEKYIEDHLEYDIVDNTQWDLGAKFGVDRLVIDNLARDFCNSKYIEDLQPWDEAVYYVTKLYQDHGYKLHIVTSLSDKPEAFQHRLNNYLKHFPAEALHKLTVLPLHCRKLEFLTEHYYASDNWWIEDKYENYVDGFLAGLRPILVSYEYNKNKQLATDTVASSWKEIYQIIIAGDSE